MAGQIEVGKPGFGVADGHLRQFGKPPSGDKDVARRAVQPFAVAGRTGFVGQEARQLLAHGLGLGLAVAALQIGEDALEAVRLGDRAPACAGIVEADALLAAAVEQQLLLRLGQFAEGLIEVDVGVLGEALEQRPVVGVAPVPATNRAAGQRQLGVGDHPLRVEDLLLAEAIAFLAGAVGGVEGEQAGFEFGQRVTAVRAGHARGKGLLLAFVFVGHHMGQAIGDLQSRFEGFGQTLTQILAHLETVHHDVDVVLDLAVERRDLVEFVDRAVDAGTHEALRAHAVEHIQVFTLAAADDWRAQQPGRAIFHMQHAVDHLRDLHGL